MARRVAALPADETLQDAAPAAMRAFFRIADAWELTSSEARILLGTPPSSTFYKWRTGDVGTLARDTLERISYLLGIYKSLQVLLPDPTAADGWIRRPNEAAPFGGESALARMLSGNVADLYVVREYLDASRGG